MSEAPPFWWGKADWRAWALWPASCIYGRIARLRLDNARPVATPLPVLCVGNLTVGGAGKTPVAIAMAKAAAESGRKPGFLSRGYGGSTLGPVLVDPHHDSARHVGDEPLLLAAHAPVAVTPDRAAGAGLLAEQGCDFLIMDDGFQSARIAIDYALIVVDGKRGVGNGHIIPGGPMRAPLVDQLRHGDAVLVVGEGDGGDRVVRQAARAAKPVHHARIQPVNAQRFTGKGYLAFAGIGDPEKFFDTVEQSGGWVSIARSFADHHLYSDDDLADLLATASASSLDIVTTAKDAARLRNGSAVAAQMLQRAEVLEIGIAFEQPSTPGRIIEKTLERFRARRVRG